MACPLVPRIMANGYHIGLPYLENMSSVQNIHFPRNSVSSVKGASAAVKEQDGTVCMDPLALRVPVQPLGKYTISWKYYYK